MQKDRVMDPNVIAVTRRLQHRAKAGMDKYGVDTTRTDLTFLEWLTHLQEELMDGAVYIERIKRELKE